MAYIVFEMKLMLTILRYEFHMIRMWTKSIFKFLSAPIA